MKHSQWTRHQALQHIERWLDKHGSPRFHMGLIVSATGACGFLFSFLFLHLGVHSMSLRYPLAVFLAYLVFLGFLKLWLQAQTRQPSVTDHESCDALDVADLVDGSSCGSGHVPDDPLDLGGAGDALGALDLEELGLVLLAVVAILAGILACLYVIWTGPTLLAEVLVDGWVMSRVYHRLRDAEPSSWLSSALRRTWLPALLTALFLGLAGLALQHFAPEAHSIGQVCRELMADK